MLFFKTLYKVDNAMDMNRIKVDEEKEEMCDLELVFRGLSRSVNCGRKKGNNTC